MLTRAMDTPVVDRIPTRGLDMNDAFLLTVGRRQQKSWCAGQDKRDVVAIIHSRILTFEDGILTFAFTSVLW